jgi:hypothetical protein
VGTAPPGFAPGLDQVRADAVLPVLRLLLGAVDADAGSDSGTGSGPGDNDLVGVA